MSDTSTLNLVTPYQIWAMLLACAGAVITLTTAIKAIVEIVKYFKGPNKKQDEEIATLKQLVEQNQKDIEQLQRRQARNDDGNRVNQIALLALLEHGIDGNHIEPMQKARRELQEYLINK